MTHSAEFCKSYKHWRDVGYPDKPEYAFIGRSNVGKSSLINLLMNRKNLAKTSSKPGKTQLLNLFLVDHKWNLMDLPGYGYAKSAKQSRNQWLGMIEGYFLNRSNLVNTFILVDAAIPPKEKDLLFCNWMGENQIPFSLVFTKTDKEKPKAVQHNIDSFRDKMAEYWDELPPVFSTTIKDARSTDAVLQYIRELNKSVLSDNP